jgi:hypothetical protein
VASGASALVTGVGLAVEPAA